MHKEKLLKDIHITIIEDYKKKHKLYISPSGKVSIDILDFDALLHDIVNLVVTSNPKEDKHKESWHPGQGERSD
jgi:hypothetical protein